MSNKGRPPEAHIDLTPEQCRELQRLARTAIGRVSERAHFVLLSDQGKSVPEIAHLMDYSAQAVYPWLERYRQKGIAGLQDNPRSGRPPKEPLLANVVAGQACMSPLCYGYAQGCWSIALLVGHLVRHFALNATRDTVRRALKRARFAWGRGKLYLPKRRDPEIGTKLERLDSVISRNYDRRIS